MHLHKAHALPLRDVNRMLLELQVRHRRLHLGTAHSCPAEALAAPQSRRSLGGTGCSRGVLSCAHSIGIEAAKHWEMHGIRPRFVAAVPIYETCEARQQMPGFIGMESHTRM